MSIEDLTPRELEIAREIAVRTYAEVGERMNMPPYTVRYHAQRIMLKIGAKRKDDIARILLEHDLL